MINKLLFIVAFTVLATSCTLSLQNVDTHGQTTDAAEDNQTASPDVSPNLTIPASVVP